MALFNRDMRFLFHELQLLRPTGIILLLILRCSVDILFVVLVGVPAIWNRFYAEFKSAVALQSKGSSENQRARIRERLVAQFSLLFGDRLQCVTTGTAPLSNEVKV